MPLEQTTATAVPPAASAPPQPMYRLNPPAEVQQQVSAAIAACTKWRPENVVAAEGATPSPPVTTEAQVCDVLNSWLVMHEVQQDLVIAQGASLGIAGAVFCATIWTVFRRALGANPLVSVLSRFMLRAAGGALCGVGVAALMTLFALHGFHAATIEQLADQAFLSWARAVPWVSAACAVLFVLSAVPGVSTGRGMLAQLSRVASPWQKQ